MAKAISRRSFLAQLGGIGLASAAGFPRTGIAQRGLRTVRISTLPTIILFPTFVARDLGHFKEFGVDAQFVIARGGSEITQLMVSGAVDLANAGAEHVFKLRETGFDAMVLTGQENRYITELVVHRKHEGKIKGVKDLKGKSIGVSGMGSGSHVSSRYVLRHAGLDPETDVTFVAVGGPLTQVKALEQGQVDAVMAFDPAQSLLKHDLKIAYRLWSGVAGDPPEIFQDFVMECLAARRSWIDKNRELAADIVRANVKAITAIREADPRVLDTYAAMFKGIQREVLRKSLNEHLAAFTPVITRKGIANVNTYGRFAGVTTKDVSYDEVVAKEFEPIWKGWKAPLPKSF